MVYEFALTADDYIAASLSSNTTRNVLRGYVPYALALVLVFWIVLRHGVAASFLALTAFAGVLFVGTLVYYGLTWQKKFIDVLARYHDGPQKSILGPHTLELTDVGLFSSGPLHRSFRAWSSVTAAVVSPSHIFFHTLFGIVYVLPLRAVEDVGSLVSTLKGTYGVSVTGAPNASTAA
jgi:hypothetical protein